MAGQHNVKKAATARNKESRRKTAGTKAPSQQPGSDLEAEEPSRKKTRLGASSNEAPTQPTRRVTVEDVDDDDDDVANADIAKSDESENEDEQLGKTPALCLRR
jgi:hypothetical protein